MVAPLFGKTKRCPSFPQASTEFPERLHDNDEVG